MDRYEVFVDSFGLFVNVSQNESNICLKSGIFIRQLSAGSINIFSSAFVNSNIHIFFAKMGYKGIAVKMKLITPSNFTSSRLSLLSNRQTV